jgi:3D (Asp-Asp-Asp) domain-containing protein
MSDYKAAVWHIEEAARRARDAGERAAHDTIVAEVLPPLYRKRDGAGAGPAREPSPPGSLDYARAAWHVEEAARRARGAGEVAAHDTIVAEVLPPLYRKRDGGGEADSLRRFKFTRYWVAKLHEDPQGTPIFDTHGTPLIRLSAAGKRTLELEGTGQLPDGRRINVGRTSLQDNKYIVLPDGVWAYGTRNNPLKPFRSLAVDFSVVPFGTRIFVKELEGLNLPDRTTHDGWCEAADTGGGIHGAHFDWFCGPEAWARDSVVRNVPQFVQAKVGDA